MSEPVWAGYCEGLKVPLKSLQMVLVFVLMLVQVLVLAMWQVLLVQKLRFQEV